MTGEIHKMVSNSTPISSVRADSEDTTADPRWKNP